MPSPFPGMNPYLEHPDAWSDFHERYLPLLARELGRQLPRSYFVKIDQNIYGHDVGGDMALIGRGDAYVVARPNAAPPDPRVSMAGLTPASGTVAFVEEFSVEESFLEIRDSQSRRVVTVIEVLSPTNKRPGEKRSQFLAKRRGLIASETNYVELDLLRGHPRLPLRGLPACDYYALVSRATLRPDAEIWAISLREGLPVLPIPLRHDDEFAPLALQPSLHEVYDDGTYDRYVYDHETTPPLSPQDADWARGLLRVR